MIRLTTSSKVHWIGDQPPDEETVDVLSELIWACLRKQRYAEGTETRVRVERRDDGFFVDATATEPGGPTRHLLDLEMPLDGLSREWLDEFAEENGLVIDPMLVFGDGTAADEPAPTRRPAGKDAKCPCGSRRKYRQCCLN
jgi:hypothetical protein